ncbi:MAG: InlB B-repeat-containing protein, partial [Clostridia bacterium]|nr:InlB B-repeat-containing protein [Clostridia bacterium]
MKIFQRIFAFAVITALVMTLIPLTVFADNEFVNSDVEFTSGDRTYIVNNEGRVYSETLPGVDVVFLTDYKADTLAVYNDSLFLSAGRELRRIDLSGGTDSFVWKSQSEIGYFSVCGGAAYALSDGTIMKINISSGKSSVYFSGYDIKKFCFSQSDTLEFMVDDEHIYTLDVKEGELTEDINHISNLGEDIPTVSPKDIDGYIETQATILSLQSKFPAGKYWNHANNPGSSNNNQNGYTSIPCPDHNGTIGTASQTCNGFAPNGSQLSWQCMGYAEKCGYDVTGYNPRNTGYGWVKSSDSSRVDTIKAGDIVRYRNGGHSIYITGVSGSTITFTDCNSDGACIIRWGRTIEKSTLKSTFTYIRIAPYEGDSVFGPGTSVNASIHLDANGGSVSVNVVRIKSGNTYGDLPVPVREGYGFDGWFTSATGGTMIDSQTKVSGDVYLYAHWTKNKYTVTYDATGGINAPAVQVKEFGEKVTISADRPERDGYRFINWNSKIDGSGKIYTGSATYSDNASIVLYA